MKRIVALVLLGALGLVVAGCASGHQAASNVTTLTSIVGVSGNPATLIVSGTATLPHIKPGTRIACKGGEPKVKVPATPAAVGAYEVGEGVSGRWQHAGPTTSLQLSRSPDGTVTVTCSRK
jgi:hypothetical protein